VIQTKNSTTTVGHADARKPVSDRTNRHEKIQKSVLLDELKTTEIVRKLRHPPSESKEPRRQEGSLLKEDLSKTRLICEQGQSAAVPEHLKGSCGVRT
jgi:hypothetical protein